MAKEKIPAWQQVVQVALRNVPWAENGQDAWRQLNEDEQAAVTAYLAEHCEGDAQAALTEICGKIKHPRWVRLCWVFALAIPITVAILFLLDWLQDVLNTRVPLYVWLALCPLNMHTAWQGNPTGKAAQIWRDYFKTREDAPAALNRMHLAYTAPRKERMNKGLFVGWLILWLLHIGLALLAVLT